MNTLPPLSLYIHIPWCVRKCPYCDFNSHTTAGDLPEPDYVKRLQGDLVANTSEAQGRKLSSIFFGGGTPSLFTGQAIKQILDTARDTIGFTDDIEITLEANPGTFEQRRFAEFRRAGVNRLSVGVQSFQAQQLNNLGRIHSETEASLAIRTAKTVGFDNINIDLMHGLPNQTVADARSDLERCIELEPSHISWYQLTIEKNTPFYSKPPTLPDTDLLADIEQEGFDILANAGFERYEISAFCRNNKTSKHNLNYWQFGDYLGIGAGAHGKITQLNPTSIIRSQATRLPQHYLEKDTGAPWKQVDKAQLPFEFMMNVLRLKKGVPVSWFTERTGLELETIRPILDSLIEKELLQSTNDILCTTDTGFEFLNSVLEAFLEQ